MDLLPIGSSEIPDVLLMCAFHPFIFVGGRYYLLSNLGVFAELGYDQTYLKVGITGKL